MTGNKRYRSECIEGVSPDFIVDTYTAKKKSEKITTFKSYDTNTKGNCEELTDLLNDYYGENEQLKNYIDYLEKQNEKLKERIEELASNNKIVFMD